MSVSFVENALSRGNVLINEFIDAGVKGNIHYERRSGFIMFQRQYMQLMSGLMLYLK